MSRAWLAGLPLAALAGLAALASGPRLAHAQAHHHHEPAHDTDAPAGTLTATMALGAEAGLTVRDEPWQLVDAAVTVGYRRLTLDARLPVAHVAPQNGETTSGLGDLALMAMVTVAASPRLTLALGAGAMLPTGDMDAQLGAGHVALMPCVQATSELGATGHVAWRVDLMAMGHVAVGDVAVDPHAGHAGHESSVHGALYAPRARHELMSRATLGLARGPLSAALGGQLLQPLVDADGLGALAAVAELGLRFGGDYRLSLDGELPVAGDTRQDWRGRLALARHF